MNNSTPINDLEPFVIALDSIGNKNLAKEVLQAFEKTASTFEQYDNLSKCYFKLKFYNDAIVNGEKATITASSPQQMYVSRHNLINVYNHANYPEKAMRYIKHCESIIPEDVDIILEKAYSHFLLNEKSEAERLLQKTLDEHDELSDEYKIKIKFNLGTYYLLRDEFQKGLKFFLEEGAKMKVWNTESIFNRMNVTQFENKTRFIKWDGTSKPGESIIIHAEAGIGDEIINFRFIEHIKKLGMIPYWYNSYTERKDLLEVFSRHGCNVISDLKLIKGDSIYYAQSMHLPIVMNLNYKDLWNGPYLHASDEYIKKWKWIKKDKPSIGIRWQGNPAYDHDLHRSYQLSQVLDLFDEKDVDLYSLQKDTGLDELDGRIQDLSSQLETWEDTLACIENLDYVITSCTSIAHAAAAMGKKVFVLVPISAYYTWSHSGDKSPWYGDNVILLRQEKPRSWNEPIEKLRNLL